MRHALRACVESASVFSLVDLPSFFLIPSVRQGVLMSLPEKNSARVYFTTRFRAREEMYVSAVLNKLEPFLGSLAVQRFLGQPKTTFDLFGAGAKVTVASAQIAPGIDDGYYRLALKILEGIAHLLGARAMCKRA